MNRIITIFLIYFLFSTITNAQNIVIEGVIKDSEQKEALPYANIFLQENYFGTISNQNGQFKIVIPQEKRNDSLVVSYIGFKTQTFSISNIKNPLEVFLKEDETTLKEVVITGYTAESIIKKAIEKIPSNYFSKPYKSKGFYRVTSQKDNSYIHLSEAVFGVYQSKIDNPKQQFKLEKMRAIKDEKASQGIDLGLKPNGIYDFDIMNNLDEIELLNKKGLKRHTFKIEGSELINGKEAYKITFDQKDIKKSGYKGYMLIDKESFAFVYFNFGLSPKGISYYKYGDASTRALMKIVGVNIDMSRSNYQISYKKFKNKYYLNNVGNDATLTFQSEREHYNFTTDTRVDYLVTEIKTDSISPFSNDEILGKGKLIEEQNSIYDAKFWEDYTIILPTNDFNEIAKKLEANNKANNFKVEIEDKLYKLPKDKKVRIDSILTFYNQKDLFNGNALISFEGKTIFQKSYNNDFTSNKANSQFRIGSLSKTFTSMIIAQLENEGKLNYNDEIKKYLPNYPNGNVTISQLLSHQSGIPNFLSNKAYLPQILSNKYSIEEVVTLFCSDTLEFESGSKFEYSNSNFVILSLIAEKIVGKNFKEILNQNIFKPLNMSDTYFGESTDKKALVTSFMYGNSEIKYNSQNVGGAGGITSTTSDLLKWSNALNNVQLLPQSKLDNLFKPQAEYNDWDAYYGYGWMIDRYMFSSSKKHKINYHPGTDFGFYSMFVKQPDSGITIILLNNTGEFPRFEITELILNESNK
ncbi:serine hydrolase [Aureibaculum luteum]|uniref:serine hydrolase n=1 Tax=Aureibaculum luteum TaxID=1548456 RepID=UPI000E54E15F|nr:serine hydrolase [Aureibaculum luteum]